jgi:hypothetical protein
VESSLLDVISKWFLKHYTIILRDFGWSSGSESKVDRDGQIVNTLVGALETHLRAPEVRQGTIMLQDLSSGEYLVAAVVECFRSAHDSAIATAAGDERSLEDEETLELALHLAAEALRFCFRETKLTNAMYTPLDTNSYHKGAGVLATLLYRGGQTDCSGLRSLVPGSLLPSRAEMLSDNLAEASDRMCRYLNSPSLSRCRTDESTYSSIDQVGSGASETFERGRKISLLKARAKTSKIRQ